jgi:tRNA A-37 threonylcarbamoyl transferase component Bud32
LLFIVNGNAFVSVHSHLTHTHAISKDAHTNNIQTVNLDLINTMMVMNLAVVFVLLYATFDFVGISAHQCDGQGGQFFDTVPTTRIEWSWVCTSMTGRGCEVAQLFNPPSAPWLYTDVCISYYGHPFEPWLSMYDDAGGHPGALLHIINVSMPYHAECAYESFSVSMITPATSSAVWIAARIGDCTADMMSPRICHTEQDMEPTANYHPGYSRRYDEVDDTWVEINTYCPEHLALTIRAVSIAPPSGSSSGADTRSTSASTITKQDQTTTTTTTTTIMTTLTPITWFWRSSYDGSFTTTSSTDDPSDETTTVWLYSSGGTTQTLSSSQNNITGNHGKAFAAGGYVAAAMAVAIAMIILIGCTVILIRRRLKFGRQFSPVIVKRRNSDIEMDRSRGMKVDEEQGNRGQESIQRLTSRTSLLAEEDPSGIGLPMIEMDHKKRGLSTEKIVEQLGEGNESYAGGLALEMDPAVVIFDESIRTQVNVCSERQVKLRNIERTKDGKSFGLILRTPSHQKMMIMVDPPEIQKLKPEESCFVKVRVRPLYGSVEPIHTFIPISVVPGKLHSQNKGAGSGNSSKQKSKKRQNSKRDDIPPKWVRLTVIVNPAVSPVIDNDDLQQYELIGQGTFADVYRGQYKGQHVAIKHIKMHHIDGQVLKAFSEEIEKLYTLRCKQIVMCVGGVFQSDMLKIITEYMPEGSLHTWLHGDHPSKRVPHDIKPLVLLDALRAMEFLHMSKILHRDLKPHNMLVECMLSAAAVRVKICDFGSSRTLLESDHTMTKAPGTPTYMPPELTQPLKWGEKRKYGFASDMFSFAVCAWEVYSEKIPYANMSYAADITQFIGEGRRLSLPDDCPREIRELITSCWNGDPSLRPTASNAKLVLENYTIQRDLTSTEGSSLRDENFATGRNPYTVDENE